MKERILLIIIVLFVSCKGDMKSEDVLKTKKIHPSQKETNVNSNSNNTIVGTNEGVIFLKNFYSKFYFDENKNFTYLDQSEFLSERINKTIESLNSDPENIELDYDPFIKAQDFYGESIKNTIKFTKEDKGFIVTFINFEEEGEVRLEFELGKNKEGKIEIVNVLNDNLLRIK